MNSLMNLAVKIVVILLTLYSASALSSPSHFNYQGRLFDSEGVPLSSGNATVVTQVISKTGNCVLFEESHTVLMDESDGFFSIVLGLGTQNTATAPAFSLSTALANNVSFADANMACSGNSYTPGANDFRFLRVSVNGETLTPDQVINSAPYAIHSAHLGGKPLAEIESDYKSYSDQNFAGSVLPDLQATPLVAGDSFRWDGTKWGIFQPAPLDLPSNSVTVDDLDFASSNGLNIPQLAADPGTPVAGQTYYNTTTNKLMVYDGTSWSVTNGGGSGVWTTSGSDISFSSGKVGIGTTSPTDRLTVDNGNMDIRSGGVLSLYNNANTNRVIIDPDHPAGLPIISTQGGSLNVHSLGFRWGSDPKSGASIDLFNAENTRSLSLQTSNSKDIFISPAGDTLITSGNVGVGTTSPAQQFEVEGSSSALLLDNGTIDIMLATNQSSSSLGLLSFGSSAEFQVDSNNDNANSTFSFVNGTGGNLMTIEESGNVGIGTTGPDASAALDILSTEKGFLPPRMTTLQKNAIVSPAIGLIVFDTDEDALFVYRNGAWGHLGGSTHSFLAKTSSAQSTPGGSCTNTTMNLSSEDFDTGDNFNTSTYQYVVPGDGVYHFSALVSFNATTGGGVYVRRNGTDLICAQYTNGNGGTLNSTCSGSYQLLAGDTVQLIAHNCGSTTTATARLSGFKVSGAGGGGVSDDLGSHIATQNISLGANYLSGDGDNEGIAIDNSGNVGIGTTSPSAKLEILGNGTGGYELMVNEGVQMYFGGEDVVTGSGTSYITSSSALGFEAGSTLSSGSDPSSYDMIIRSNGNIGVGTASPTKKLDVNGTITASAFDLPIQRVSSTGAASADNMLATATCPTDYVVIGGGCETVAWGGRIVTNKPVGTTQWTCAATHSYSPSTYSTTAYAICVKVQ